MRLASSIAVHTCRQSRAGAVAAAAAVCTAIAMAPSAVAQQAPGVRSTIAPPSAAKAASPLTTGSTPQAAQKGAPAWLLKCDSAAAGFDCRASQTIVMQTGQKLLTVTVRRPSKAEGPALMLNLPHGVFLPAGATVQVDKDKPMTLPIQTSDPHGAYAGSPIARELLAAMQKSEKLTVSFQDLQKRTITVPVPLAGFADAYQKMP